MRLPPNSLRNCWKACPRYWVCHTQMAACTRLGYQKATGVISYRRSSAARAPTVKGNVHYGDVVPDKYRSNAKAVPLRNDAPSPARERDAQLPLQKDREPLKAASRASEPASPAIIDSPAPQLQTDNLSCDEQWDQYFEALECFGPYRNANGSTKVEALSHCPIVKEPTGCDARRASARAR